MEDKIIGEAADQVKAEIKAIVRQSIGDTVQEALEPITKKLDSIQQVVDHTRTELEDQGREISNINITQSEHAASLRELLGGVNKQTRNIVQKITTQVETTVEDIGNKMQKKVKPAVEGAIDDFLESNKKKIRAKKRHFLPGWLRRN